LGGVGLPKISAKDGKRMSFEKLDPDVTQDHSGRNYNMSIRCWN